MGVLGGGQKVYVEKVYVLFPSPIKALRFKLTEHSDAHGMRTAMQMRDLVSIPSFSGSCLKNGHAHVETCVLKTLARRKNVGGFFKHW